MLWEIKQTHRAWLFPLLTTKSGFLSLFLHCLLSRTYFFLSSGSAGMDLCSISNSSSCWRMDFTLTWTPEIFIVGPLLFPGPFPVQQQNIATKGPPVGRGASVKISRHRDQDLALNLFFKQQAQGKFSVTNSLRSTIQTPPLSS